jgi:hypothetical protein
MALKFFYCPECGKKGVSFRLRNEDCWVCRYCQWAIFDDDHDRLDRIGMTLLAEANKPLALNGAFWWTDREWFPYVEPQELLDL